MSIIQRENPLNLQYKICLVTSASSPLGVVICKTLLKANALVLGIDDKPCDGSLNAGLGTHFQFEERSLDDFGVEDVVRACEEKFEGLAEGGRVDVFVDVRNSGGGIGELTRGIADGMREGGGGSVVVVAEGGEDERSIDFAKSLAKRHEGTAVRTNVIIPEPTIPEGQSGEAYEEAKAHMTALIKTERPGKQEVPSRFYEVGNLVLFLAGGMSEEMSGNVFALDGSWRRL